jgi:hypothetical protein
VNPAVDVLKGVDQLGPLFVGEALQRIGVGVRPADADGGRVDAEFAQRFGERELAAENADGAGDGRAIGDDRVGAGGDVIAA